MENNFFCLECKVNFRLNKDYLECPKCNRRYPVIEDIPVFIENLDTNQLTNQQYTDSFYGHESDKERTLLMRSLGDYYPDEPSQIFLKLFKQELKFKRVLDLGCGSGQLSLGLLKNLEFADEVYGLDISLNALLTFRKNIHENKIDKKIILLCSTAEKIFLPDNYFDAVLCQKFIHHLPLDPFFGEVNRVLKKGRYFICLKEPYLNFFTTYFKRIYYTCINFTSLLLSKIRRRKYYGEVIYKVKTKKFLYSKSYIERLLRRKGFDIEFFHFSKFLFPFTKMILYPFYLKFPSLRVYFSHILKLIYKIDSHLFEKLIFKEFLQEISFYSRKL